MKDYAKQDFLKSMRYREGYCHTCGIAIEKEMAEADECVYCDSRII